MKYIIIELLLLSCFAAHAQDTSTIVYGNSRGDSLRLSGNIKEALLEYHQRRFDHPDNIVDTYNYACTFAIDRQLDSAFKYLQIAVGKSTDVAALVDPDLIYLHHDKRWSGIEDTAILKTEQLFGKFKNLPLAKKLWRMKARDQAYYYEISLAEQRKGDSSPVVRALWDLKERINEENRKELEQIVAEYGWPKISEVKDNAADAAFLVIQHSEVTLQKKYLPVIRERCEQNEANWSNYALMYDRIQVSENKNQLYGSQLFYDENMQQYKLYPIDDEENLDERRTKMGLESMAQYLSGFGINYQLGK